MTAPNKNEGLIRQLLMVRSMGARKGKHWNPDGPDAARAIQDLEEEVAALRADAARYRYMRGNMRDSEELDRICDEGIERLASTADGGS